MIAPTYKELGLTETAEPARRLRRRGVSASWDGAFASNKALGVSDFESLLERDCQTLLSADPRIQAYACQPHKLTYFLPTASGVEKREYTPDFAVLTRSGRALVVEAKAFRFASGAKWKRLEPHIRDAYREDHKVDFLVWTEREIRLQPRFDNAKALLRHRFAPHDRRAEYLARDALGQRRLPVSIGSICEQLEQDADVPTAETYSAIMRLALKGEIRLDGANRYSLATHIQEALQ